MLLKDLTNDMVVTLRRTTKATVKGKDLRMPDGNKWESNFRQTYNSDLTSKDSREYDIIKVEWNAPDILEVTMADIEEEFGCRVKIIGEEK